MFLIVAGVIEPEALQEVRREIDALQWRDGRDTAGAVAGAVKRNEQAVLERGPGARLRRRLGEAVAGHPVVRAAARPKRYSRLLISRTNPGGGYGPHTDNPFMGAGASRVRTDVSYTLFLSEPEAYGGGALTIDLAGVVQSLKPAAGDLVLYPSTSIHQVEPVTHGARLAAVGWIESDVRDPARREVLFDVENLRADLRSRLPADAPALLQLDKIAANLARLWAER